MCEAAQFFEDALQEYGVENAIVHQTDEVFGDTFYITKNIGEENLCYQTTITNHHSDDELRQQIAYEAQHIAQEFNEHMMDEIQWGDCRPPIRVSPYDGGWAECTRCGNKVDAPLFDSHVHFQRDAELTNPHPHPVESIGEDMHAALKMYLLGLVKEECETACPNSNCFLGHDRKI